MIILAHRGYWNNKNDGNTPQSIWNALKNGYSFESDVRDYMGRLVISHNIADATSQDAEEVFKWLVKYKNKYCFAINIKADGLKEILYKYIQKYNISNYFLFDMSVPQMVEFEDMGLRFFTRQSEVEPIPCMYDKAAGVWIDGFWGTDWITEGILSEHIRNGKDICVVSPDLHGRQDYRLFWKQLASYRLDFSRCMLCTDYPDEARAFFRADGCGEEDNGTD